MARNKEWDKSYERDKKARENPKTDEDKLNNEILELREKIRNSQDEDEKEKLKILLEKKEKAMKGLCAFKYDPD